MITLKHRITHWRNASILLIALLLLLVCLPCLARQQKSDHQSSQRYRAVGKPKTGLEIAKQRSEMGIYLNAITRDSNSHIWVAGSVWLLEGLLLHYNGEQTTAMTMAKFSVINDLMFTGSEGAWMITDYKHLYRTNDGGSTWQKNLKAKANLSSICFNDGQHGWVCGWHGAIYRTTDGGGSWIKQTTGTEYDLKKIAFADAVHGWAIGGKAVGPDFHWDSVLLATKNGGETWTTIKPAPSLSEILFIDTLRGWGIGMGNGIFQTSDGGATWALQYQETGGWLSSLFFISEKEGWAAGSVVLHTGDGGRTWDQYTETEFKMDVEHILFLDSVRGWGITQGKLVSTSDGGRTWETSNEKWKERVVGELYWSKFGNRN